MSNKLQVKKDNFDSDCIYNNSSIEIQQRWIDGLRDQVQWLNRPDILTDYVLQLRIYRRRLVSQEKETGTETETGIGKGGPR